MGMFKPATREKLKLRLALDGPSGSGKTYTALRMAFSLAGPNGKVAVIDTEHRSASKYQGYTEDGVTWNFDVCELESYAPSTYSQVIKEAGRLGYDVLIIDSLSHAWEGVGGALDLVDRKAGDKGNSFTAWKDVTPLHREMIESILAVPCHIIATMRTKTEWVLEPNEKGKMVPRKVGTAPVQRQGVEFEFDVVGDLDETHTLVVSKTRCPSIDGARVVKPGAPFMEPIRRWLDEGVEPAERPAPVPQAGETVSVQATVSSGSVQLDTTAAATPPESKSEYSQAAGDRCSSSQVDQIKEWAAKLNMPAADVKAIAVRRRKASIRDLTGPEAEQVIAKLRQKATAQEAAAHF